MSYVQQIKLVNHIRGGLTPECNFRLEIIKDLSFMPVLPDEDYIEIMGAELSLLYLEFHKQFELCEIIRHTADKVASNDFQISRGQLQNIIGEWRMHLKTLKGEALTEGLRIERKLSDLFQLEELNNHYWAIVYWHEGDEIYES
jgi:hypothetical protein